MDSQIDIYKGQIEDGALRKGFLVVSRSKFWVPWVADGVCERIEVGLFDEYSSTPEGPSFGMEWRQTVSGTVVEIRSPAGAWDLLPLLHGFESVVSRVAASAEEEVTVEEVAKLLANNGFEEARDDLLEPDELPLPPAEPLPNDTSSLVVKTRSGGMPCADDVRWVGPHIGRTLRFFTLLEEFIDELRRQRVPAFDVKAGYTDSAFHRLWECVNYEDLDESMVQASGRDDKNNVPVALTDTQAYLETALWQAEEAVLLSGGLQGNRDLTLIAPISEVLFQIPEATSDDEPRLELAFERAGEKTDLKVSWTDTGAVVSLPDTDEYRPHAVSP